MSDQITITAVAARAVKTKKGDSSVIYDMTLADGRTVGSWVNPSVWGWNGTPGLTVSGTVTNKPWVNKRTGLAENSWQFTADAVAAPTTPPTPSPTPPTTPPGAPPVPVGTTSAPGAAPAAPTPVQSAFNRLIDKDRTIARESILSSVAVMLPTLSPPLNQEHLSRGWEPADVLAVCDIFESWIYRVNGDKS